MRVVKNIAKAIAKPPTLTGKMMQSVSLKIWTSQQTLKKEILKNPLKFTEILKLIANSRQSAELMKKATLTNLFKKIFDLLQFLNYIDTLWTVFFTNTTLTTYCGVFMFWYKRMVIKLVKILHFRAAKQEVVIIFCKVFRDIYTSRAW